MSDVPRSLQSWVSTIQTAVLTTDVFQLFIETHRSDRLGSRWSTTADRDLSHVCIINYKLYDMPDDMNVSISSLIVYKYAVLYSSNFVSQAPTTTSQPARWSSILDPSGRFMQNCCMKLAVIACVTVRKNATRGSRFDTLTDRPYTKTSINKTKKGLDAPRKTAVWRLDGPPLH